MIVAFGVGLTVAFGVGVGVGVGLSVAFGVGLTVAFGVGSFYAGYFAAAAALDSVANLESI